MESFLEGNAFGNERAEVLYQEKHASLPHKVHEHVCPNVHPPSFNFQDFHQGLHDRSARAKSRSLFRDLSSTHPHLPTLEMQAKKIVYTTQTLGASLVH